LPNAGRDIDPTHIWKADIEKYEIRLKLFSLSDRIHSCSGFPNDFQIGLGRKNRAYSAPDYVVVIDH
jgi:hypothetical protein